MPFFKICLSELLQSFRQATLVTPLVTYAYVEEWLAVRIQRSMLEQGIECNYQTPTYLEWEALSQVRFQFKRYQLAFGIMTLFSIVCTVCTVKPDIHV